MTVNNVEVLSFQNAFYELTIAYFYCNVILEIFVYGLYGKVISQKYSFGTIVSLSV